MVWRGSYLTRTQRTVLALIMATATQAQTPTPFPVPLPTSLPIPTPTKLPIPSPTNLPIPAPTLQPTPLPTYEPTDLPTPVPTYEPSAPSPQPTPPPTSLPTPLPTSLPTLVPSLQPSPVPTTMPTPLPTPVPTSLPTPVPSFQPTPLPSPVPTLEPTPAPTLMPTPAPSPAPSPVPTPLPTPVPTPAPTPLPSPLPTPVPTPIPTPVPSPVPTLTPTPVPTLSPTPVPTPLPTKFPTPSPTPAPTSVPTYLPSRQPSRVPSSLPTLRPTGLPSLPPTPLPSTSFPSPAPTVTNNPTPSPTPRPSHTPTSLPTPRPTRTPTLHPTPYPTKPPTPSPTRVPSLPPTRRPTPQPSLPPTPKPTTLPSPRPTRPPTLPPTDRPTPLPSEKPSRSPSSTPTSAPTLQPTTEDTSRVTVGVVITASAELPTAADQAAIESAAANAVGVETSALRNFAVSSTALNRRLESHDSAKIMTKNRQRQLTTSWSWDISFVVEGQLTAVGAATAAEWASTVNTALTDGTFANAVIASVSSADAVSTPWTQVNTRTPSSMPSEAPTPDPTPMPTPVPTDSPPPTPAPSTRPSKFIWKPDNISIAISARHAGPHRLNELNTATAAASDSASANQARRFGSLSNAAEAGNVTLVLSAAHRVLPAEHTGWGHWALSLNNGTEMTRCLDWHATEDQIEDALNVLPSVRAQSALSSGSSGSSSGSRDRVVVRKSGGGAGEEGGYGYTIQLSMRSPNGSAWLASPSAGVKVRRSSIVALDDWAPAASEALQQQQSTRQRREEEDGGADYDLRSGYGDGTHPLNGGSSARFAVPCDPVWTWGEWDDPSQWTYDESGGSRSATQAPGATVVRTAATAGAGAAGTPDAKSAENGDDDTSEDADDSTWHAGGRAGPGGVVVADEDQDKALDMVLIPRGSGFVQLGRSVAVRGLEMRGGTLATMRSGCPSGWAKPSQASSSSSSSSDGVADRQTKCYAAFRGPPAHAASPSTEGREGSNAASSGPYGGGYGLGRSEADFSPAGGYDQSRGLNRADAEATCAAIAPGAAGHLVRIESLAENELVRGLCQGLAWRPREPGPGDARADLAGRAGGDGSPGSSSSSGDSGDGTLHGSDESGNHRGDGSGRSAGVRGDLTAAVLGDDGSPAISQARDPTCWIGLALEQTPGWSGAGKGNGNGAARDSLHSHHRRGSTTTSSSGYGVSGSEPGDGFWRWPDEHEVSDVTWRAWARGEPDNATSDVGGEACAAMGPSLYSVERQHMGLWHDERCSNRFAFVCERFAVSLGHTLVVGPKGFDWRGGAVTGGGTLQVLGPTAVHAGFGGGYRPGAAGGDFDVSSSRWASNRDDDFNDDYYSRGSSSSDGSVGWSSGGGWSVGGLSAEGGWIQRHGVIGPSIGDGASVEAWGGAAFQANAVVEGGDGASFNVLSADPAPGSVSSSSSFSSSSLGSDFGADLYGQLPPGSPWALWRLLDNNDDDDDAYTTGSSVSSWPDWATAAGHGLMNSTGRGLLTLGANATLRITRGERAPWEAPPPPPTGGNSQASRMAVAARAKRSSSIGRQARARAMSLAVPSTEPLELSPLRGVFVDGSGHVTVALPVAGSGRRPKLVNHGVVLFAPDHAASGGGGGNSTSSSNDTSNSWQGGPALVEWFYEAGGSGVGASVDGLGASLQPHNAFFNFTHASANRTGTLVVSSTTHSLVLAGGGLATGGAAVVVASGMPSSEQDGDDSSSSYFSSASTSDDVDDAGLSHVVGVVLANYSMVLAAPPTFLLRLSAERPVVDEERSAATVEADLLAQRYDRSRYSNGGSGYNQYPDPTGGFPKRHYGVNGTYRLAVQVPATSAVASSAYYAASSSSSSAGSMEVPWDETVCLPYHASAAEVEAALEALPVVQALGGVTLTRDGNAEDPRWGFGYAYRVVFDAAEARANGGLRGPPRSAGGDVRASNRGGAGGAWAWDLQGGIMRPGPAIAATAAKATGGYAATPASVKASAAAAAAAASVRLPQSPAHGNGASLWVACQGSSAACGCSEVLANLPMASGGPAVRHGCRHSHNSSLENPNQCTVTPRLTVALLHGGGEAWIGDGVARVDQYSAKDRDTNINASQPSAMPTSKPTTANEFASGDKYNSSSSGSNDGTRWVAPPAITVVGGAHRLPSTLGGGVGLSVWSGEAYVLTTNFSAAFVAIGRPNISSTAAAGAVGASLHSALFGSPYGTRALDGSVSYQGAADWNEDGWRDGASSSQARRSGGANGTFGLAAYGGGLGGGGLLICGGAGFVGLDSAQLLYEPGDRKGRSSLTPSVFFGSVRGGLAIGHGGELRIATNNHAASGFTARKVALTSGALLSGWATTTATRSLVIDGHGPKRLRTAAKLVCGVACEGKWRSSGAVWLSEGAAILNRGRLVLSARAPEDSGWFDSRGQGYGASGWEYGGVGWGNSGTGNETASSKTLPNHLFQAYGAGNGYGGGSDGYGGGGRMGVPTLGDVDMGYAASRQGWAPGEQWVEESEKKQHPYGDLQRSASSSFSGRWYTNPVCGPHCARAPFLINTLTGTLVVSGLGRPRIGLFVRQLGVVEVAVGSRLTLSGGGDGDGTWKVGGKLRISGGTFLMDGSATVLTGVNTNVTVNNTEAPTVAPTMAPSTAAFLFNNRNYTVNASTTDSSSIQHTSSTLNYTDINTTSVDSFEVIVMVNGTVEVTGGGAHQLADVFDGPRLVILGGKVEVRSRFHDLKGGLTVHDGELAYTVATARVFWGRGGADSEESAALHALQGGGNRALLVQDRNADSPNVTVTGGTISFVEVLPLAAVHPTHFHNGVKNADRTFVTCAAELHWSGGTLRGNAEVGARTGLRLGEARSPLAVATPWANGESAFADQTQGRSATEAAARMAGAQSLNAATGSSFGSVGSERYRAAHGGESATPQLPLYARPPMRLEALLTLVSYGRTRWFEGDVTTAGGASLVEAGVVWMENPGGHTARVLVEPVPGSEARRASLVSVWEDNEASIHQDFGGFA